MKKVALFTCFSILALSLSSCSKDDKAAPPGGTMSFTFDGTAQTFKTTNVVQHIVSNSYDNLTVTASDGTANNLVTFTLYEYSVGATAVNTVTVTINGQSYTTYSDALLFNIVDNTGTHLTGTFSGAVATGFQGEAHPITDGTFDITYTSN